VTTVRPALDAALRHTIALRTEALFRRSGAFREGHFLLPGGQHGAAFLDTFQLLQNPALTGELCAFLAEHGRGRDREPLVDVVAGPTTAGVILAFDTARQLGVRDVFADEVRTADGSVKREFRHGFRIEPGERVLLVDDILATGQSLLAMVVAIETMGGEIVECVVFVDRRDDGRATLTSPTTGRVYALRSLWQVDVPAYERGPATCPRCADGTPLAAPMGATLDAVGFGASAH
jgi:orotate phosphoribosyltransferase